MSLRDEILAKREQDKENERIAAEQEAKRIEEQKIRESNENAQKFAKLKSDLENGIVPKDWLDLYDKYINKIKQTLSSANSFAAVEDVTEEFYLKKKNCGGYEENELTLMNAYLTKRLHDEGMKEVRFELVEEIEKYATEGDYRSQRELQAKYDERAEEKYRDACTIYACGDGYGDFPTKEYRYAELVMTGRRKVYKIRVQCSLYGNDYATPAENSSYSSRGSSSKKKKLLISAGVIAGICIIGLVIYFIVKGG